MNKFDYKNLTPFKWFVLENFPFIEADFDALTEWQLFCKLGKEINKIIDSQNVVGTEMEKFSQAFIELQNYVNNYFENLDVQDEINNKLNEMTQDGTLAEIINQDIFNELNNRILYLEQNQLIFEEIEETSIYNKFPNFENTIEYVNNSLIYISKIKNLEKISCVPTNGNPSNPNKNALNIIDLSKHNRNFDFFINGGLQGIMIFDGIVYEGVLDSPYYIGFDNKNKMYFFDALNNNITVDYLLSLGITNCFSGYSPIIENNNVFDYTTITNLSDTNNIAKYFKEYIVEQKHPRQLIAQDNDGIYYTIAILGRSCYNDGMNYDEMIQYFKTKNFANVFNLDGGGSTQTVFNQNSLIFPAVDNNTDKGRAVPSAIAFRIKEV